MIIIYLKLLVMYFHSQIMMLLIEMIRSMFRGPVRQSGNSNLQSLNIGEAVVAGLMVPVPAMVKIGEFKRQVVWWRPGRGVHLAWDEG
ncbi:hypothetical protein FVF72_00795 [Methanothermobacter sp. KEPCO-1]|uniref:Uncharacterized protein n=1 Tax=Methanothermobacter marburgensis (strain ATCC BAA-927 / DSM 2133 / JCM 14651 / NBRC 100331 / OCM 82 / Marburg) TaxID=79929 RepID=D9PVU3_METTM|nr:MULTISPECIES: hypothetical protein [Methanothermobacter]ADL58341.1 hypothetical protein MTBMA_c07460 [Methanothermobacter marburgensis str. Marburg]QEF93820.1 hypothetical protein FVF72_00795 [Methanothermobacter sp. KEPCO-1]WBF10492.1 hypothetical protein ISG34_03705 [Methanothermobacter marburgensis]